MPPIEVATRVAYRVAMFLLLGAAEYKERGGVQIRRYRCYETARQTLTH